MVMIGAGTAGGGVWGILFRLEYQVGYFFPVLPLTYFLGPTRWRSQGTEWTDFVGERVGGLVLMAPRLPRKTVGVKTFL